ncbi:hypothetical protein GCM10007380_08720 [Gottfriedia solisilvae]|uniref:Uncharacterized protein n=1 Tax=Gottfriedia solisilvae TaxID=1516104 RepID=A0A8J3ACW7_9BACI|nr:hypothetical protein GCM10007380_08720 [Gottfriedia solisilvae]
MKILALVISLICIIIPLRLLYKELKETKKINDRMGMIFGFFFEPLEPWSMLFYVGFLGFLYSVIFL